MTDFITGRVRAVFRDAVSQRMVLREIDRIWQAEGFAPGTTTFLGGQRVTLWAEYEASVDWASLEHIRRVLRVYESFLIEFGGDDITPFTRVLEVDGFSVDSSRKITMVGGALSSLSGLDGLRDASGIRDTFRRIELLLDSDPAGVVGAVKELIEATAKTILEHLGETVAKDADLPSLLSRTQDVLGLSASGVSGTVDSSGAIKKVLGGLKGVAIGITELRNAEGSGHGRTRASNLATRHARLAVNAGRTWCEIVLDTYGDPAAPWRRAGAPKA
ncbi:abortive infection family protein [Gulosibacter chungangensis]|uniref:Abortive infection family protein n=1 Tax=Gulosibacter chungangensis TaxID=979746 RepID=A0A7J5BCY2_9MICO|nr:abortive infection family protein [Gulosibacter chungangensis]KAB1643902.1 abortive infection family protein [Gulosibacter chungangensis]